MIELRLPNIKGNEREQLAQIRSYLYQLAEQLQWALNNTSAITPTYVAPQTSKKTASSSQSLDAEVAFDAVKPFIIKSADIVNAYSEKISTKLLGSYVAKSDFGAFVEETEQEISQSSTDIEQLFSDLQQIQTDIENLDFELAEVNAHIKSGLLCYDDNGIPVYGLEIGQKNTVDGEEVFNKFARFTADRLSFYDQNDTEVAYVSDYKLYIRNVEIKNSYKIGGFVETVTASGDVVTKWVGGDG